MIPETRNEASESNILSFRLSSLSQDVPLISLANILHNAKLWNDAVVVATMAVEIAPHFAVNHFTLGNVYVAMVRLGASRAPQLCPVSQLQLRFKTYLTVPSSFL